jgi:hypothetical protein
MLVEKKHTQQHRPVGTKYGRRDHILSLRDNGEIGGFTPVLRPNNTSTNIASLRDNKYWGDSFSANIASLRDVCRPPSAVFDLPQRGSLWGKPVRAVRNRQVSLFSLVTCKEVIM